VSRSWSVPTKEAADAKQQEKKLMENRGARKEHFRGTSAIYCDTHCQWNMKSKHALGNRKETLIFAFLVRDD
jgi:hypothetical protein